jgi:hypothetical protein
VTVSCKQVVSTRSAIQQTELSHLTPASAKQKARFMNLQPTLKWASMILWQLGSVRKLCSYARQSVDCPPSGDGSYGGIRVF